MIIQRWFWQILPYSTEIENFRFPCIYLQCICTLDKLLFMENEFSLKSIRYTSAINQFLQDSENVRNETSSSSIKSTIYTSCIAREFRVVQNAAFNYFSFAH